MGSGLLNCMCAETDEARRPAIMKKFFIVELESARSRCQPGQFRRK